MTRFLAALSFLTIIPVRSGHVDEKSLGRSGIYFPLVGLLIGLLLALTDHALASLGFSAVSSAIVLTVVLVIITRGLHLDGLADTSDAFLSGKSKEEMLTIMRDPHIGTMGVLAIASALLLKVAFLAALEGRSRAIALVLMCIFSRWSLVLGVSAFPYARDQGKAKAFTDGSSIIIFAAATVVSIAFGLAFWGVKGIAVFAIAAACAYLMHWYVRRRIGGITGDTLGAVNEIIEIVVLVSAFALARSIL